jgi:hypothetical protein
MVMALRGFAGSPDKRKGHTESCARVQQSSAFTSSGQEAPGFSHGEEWPLYSDICW